MNSKSNVVPLFPADRDRSTATDELNAINYQLQIISEAIWRIDEENKIQNNWEVDKIKRAVNTIAQRAHRADQCIKGLKVWKA